MKWNRCAQYRERLALLAGGVLPPEETGEVESHLTACAECREYYGDLKEVVAPLASWERQFDRLEPCPAAQRDLRNAVLESGAPRRVKGFTPGLLLLECWRQLIWPSRRIWGG